MDSKAVDGFADVGPLVFAVQPLDVERRALASESISVPVNNSFAISVPLKDGLRISFHGAS